MNDELDTSGEFKRHKFPVGETKLKNSLRDEEVGRHVEMMCNNAFENFHLYMHRLPLDLSKKSMLMEMVLVNLIGAYICEYTPKMNWEEMYDTYDEFIENYLQYIDTAVRKVTHHMLEVKRGG